MDAGLRVCHTRSTRHNRTRLNGTTHTTRHVCVVDYTALHGIKANPARRSWRPHKVDSPSPPLERV